MTLASNWGRLRRRYVGTRRYFRLTPALYALYREVETAAADYVAGDVLDAGAGLGAWAAVCQPRARRYVKTDLSQDAADVVADLKRLPYRAGVFDAVVCLQVLEHDEQPERILAELERVLKPAGVIILSVPHLSRIHDAPRDYWRFTRYGLARLLENSAFDVISLTPAGGFFSFAIHNVNVAALALLAPIPLLGRLAAALARCSSPAFVFLDRLTDVRSLLPMNYVALGRKRGR